MKREKQDNTIGRRDFLRTAGLGAGAAGVAAVALRSPSAKAALAGDAKPNSGGYRETDHVKRYYELARR